MKFKTKLTFFTLSIILLVALVVSYVLYTTNIKIIEDQIKENFENLALNTMDMVDRMLFERLANIKMMAVDPVISSKDSGPEAITKRLIAFRDNYKTYISISFFDLNRIRIADTSGLHLGKEHKEIEWARDVFDNPIVSAARDIRFSESTKQPVIYFSAPVKDEAGKIFGAVVARVPVHKLYEIVKEAIIHIKARNVEVNLYNKEGLLLYSNVNRKGILKDNFSDKENVELKAGAKSGTLKHFHPNGDKSTFHVYARQQGFLDFKGHGWFLVFDIAAKESYAPVKKLHDKIVIILFPIAIFILIVTWLFSKAFSKPLGKLREAAIKIGRGERDVYCEVKTDDEIGQLANAFNQMYNNLRQTRNELKAIIEGTTDAIYLKDLNGGYLMINPSGANMLGKEVNEIIGKSDIEFFSPETAKRITDHDREIIMKGKTVTFEEEILAKEGKFHFLTTKGVYIDQDGNIGGVYGIARDITNRRQTEEALKESEQRFKSLVSNIPGVIYRCANDPDWTIYFISDAIEEISGYPASDFIHNNIRSYASIIHPYDLESIDKKVQSGVEKKEPYVIEYRVIHANSEIRWVYEKGQGVFDSNGNFLSLDGAIFDITEQKLAEEKLKAAYKDIKTTQRITMNILQDLNLQKRELDTSLREKEALLWEIHHRVKNNLQVLSGLLVMQLDAFSDRDISLDNVKNAFKDCQKRVDTMSMVHERLYRTKNFAHINFKDFIKDLTYDLVSLYRQDTITNFEFTKDDVTIPLDKAITLGLIANELISNSMKYAFPDKVKGTLQISLNLSQQGIVTLSVSDDGVGLPEDMDWRSTETLGFRLVKGLVAQMDGNLEIDRSKGGACFTITLKKG